MPAQIKFVDLASQYSAYKPEIDKAVLDVLASNSYILGPQLAALEEEMRQYCGGAGADAGADAVYAIGCANGTDALLLAMLAAGIKQGDEVITTSFTFVSTVETICLLGAVPKFVDIDFASALIDEDLVEAEISDKTKAIVPVSLFGQMPDLDKLNGIAAKHGLVVIEDGAQSFGASRNGKHSCALTKYATTSFYPAKPLGCYGEGGAVFSDSEEEATRLRSLLNHGQSTRYEYVDIGINGRLDDIQAAILRVKLKHYDTELEKRRSIAATYDAALAEHPSLQPLALHPQNTSVYAQYSVYAPDAAKRDLYRKLLGEEGVPTGVYYPKPLHQHEVYSGFAPAEKDKLAKTEEASQRIFSLPVHPFLSEEELQQILAALTKLN